MEKIIVISSVCSNKKYDEIYAKRNEKILDPSQKYFHNLVNGLSNFSSVRCISALPVSQNTYNYKSIEASFDTENGIEYDYLGFKNGKLSRQITTLKNAFKELRKYKNEQAVFVVDVLNLPLVMAVKMASKFYSIKTVGVCTDLPNMVTCIGHKKYSFCKKIALNIYDKILDKSTKSFDGYIVLVEEMNGKINPRNKPHIVIEGFVEKVLDKKTSNNVIVYAGGLYEKYGVLNLAKAFDKYHISDCELHFYGKGPAVEEINNLRNPNIKYMGIVSVKEVEEIEANSLLLVNPRPTNEEFTKYSFPSKTLEYMASGTALATTKLSGIPKEYYDYIYLFENYDVDSLGRTLQDLMNNGREKLDSKGKSAQTFVIENKNILKLAKKIYNFLEYNVR